MCASVHPLSTALLANKKNKKKKKLNPAAPHYGPHEALWKERRSPPTLFHFQNFEMET